MLHKEYCIGYKSFDCTHVRSFLEFEPNSPKGGDRNLGEIDPLRHATPRVSVGRKTAIQDSRDTRARHAILKA